MASLSWPDPPPRTLGGVPPLDRLRLDAAIQDSVKELAVWLGSERTSLGVLEQNGSLGSVYTYVTPGSAVSPGPAVRELDWRIEELAAGRRVLAQDAPGSTELPKSDRARERVCGPRSTLLLPLQSGNEVLGGLRVEHFAVSCDWPEPLLSQLEVASGVLAEALFRRSARARMQAMQSELALARAALEKAVLMENALENPFEPGIADGGPQHASAIGLNEIVGTSPLLATVLAQIGRVAETNAPVLVLGETGTGKELVARAVHDRSRRRERPLVVVNCAALPATLVESELFGYEKGAFTGATQRSMGRFESAHGGTLFLDEVGELSFEVQAKLLRVLQTGTFERLGSSKTTAVNVRLIAATNRDLAREVREGRFRADLYYRLNVFPIELPPLRERPDDVPLLVWHFIMRRQATLGRMVKRVPDELMRAFAAYSWPGNVRELENIVERALILTSGPELAADPAFLKGTRTLEAGASSTLAAAERTHIRSALEACGWKVSGKGNAADRLGLKRSTLQFRMKKLGIQRTPHF